MTAYAILTLEEMAAADRAAAAAGTPVELLMERAGEATAAAILTRFDASDVLVICGLGDNGGDGYVAARALQRAGRAVRVAALGEPTTRAAIAARAAWSGPVGRLSPEALGGAGLVVDALFGAGLKRELPAEATALFKAAEQARLPLAAIDLPSGLAGDSGRPLGYAPRARLTVTFHRKKPAHLLEPGRSLCGELVVVDIGLPPPEAPRLFENTPGLWAHRLPWPSVEAHKHQRGRLLVVSGPIAATGAARLAARSGLRAGAGLVTVMSPLSALAVNAAALEAVMVKLFEDPAALQLAAETADAAVIGPGAGVNELTAANLRALATTGAALVVDADALTVFHEHPDSLFALLDRDDVLTPHTGEFERVFPGVLAAEPSKIAAARVAARRAGAVVVLKGPDTVIAAPDGRAAVNANGSPWLATAGSGDVLAGLVAGLIAQGMESFEAACAAVFIHAEAGSNFGPGLIAEDLPDLAPKVLARLWAERRTDP